MNKKISANDQEEKDVFFLDEEKQEEEEAHEAANKRDLAPDEFDDDPSDSADDDRVRGAGRQSLDQIAIERGEGWGLEEGRGGLRSDVPDQNVNDVETRETA